MREAREVEEDLKARVGEKLRGKLALRDETVAARGEEIGTETLKSLQDATRAAVNAIEESIAGEEVRHPADGRGRRAAEARRRVQGAPAAPAAGGSDVRTAVKKEYEPLDEVARQAARPDRGRPADRAHRGGVPRVRGALRPRLHRRHGRRGRALDPRAARPRGAAHQAPERDPDHQRPAQEEGHEATARRRGAAQVRQPPRVDDHPGAAGAPARPAPDGAARGRPLRDLRPQRPLPARHQPQQPPEAAARTSARPRSSSATRSACCRRRSTR